MAPDPGAGVDGLLDLEALAAKELHRSRRYGRSFSLAVFALDVGELARETGPGAAQAAARGLAAALSRIVRDADTLARASDGEHHLLLPETDHFGARVLMRRAWEEIRREPGLRAGGDRSIRAVSMGSATFPVDGGDAASLLAACRRRQAERRTSMLFRDAAEGLGAAAPFWHLAGALLDRAPIPAGSPSARLPLEPDLLDAVETETAREIGRDPRIRAVVYLARPGGGDRMAAALPRLEGAAREGDTSARVHVLVPRSDARGRARQHPLVARTAVDADRRLEDHALLVLVSERASYALLQAPDGRVFHTSDAPLVDALAAKLQAHYRLPPPLERDEALARLEHLLRPDGAARGAEGLEGSLAQIQLVDLLQILAVNRKTGRLEIAGDGARGEIALDEGRVVDASTGAAKGEKALFRLLTWHHGRFAFVSGSVAGPRRIEKRLEELALDGLRQADEAARLLPSLPASDEPIRLTAVAALPDGMDPVTAEVASLLARPRTVQEVLDAASAGDLDVLRALAALLARGHARREPRRAALAGVSPLLAPGELRALRARIEGSAGRTPRPTGKVVLLGGGPLARRSALVRLAALPGFSARADGAPVAFGTVGHLAIGEGASVDVVALPSDPGLAPLWRPFAAGAVAALVLSPAEEIASRAVELAGELRATLGACAPSEETVEPALRAAPSGCAYLGADPAEALRALVALAGGVE